MNFGPRKIVISIAAIPAISTSPRSIAVEAISPISIVAAVIGRHRRRAGDSASVKRSSSTEREPLTRIASPGSSEPAISSTAASGSGAHSSAA